jgi:hypothetical protein
MEKFISDQRPRHGVRVFHEFFPLEEPREISITNHCPAAGFRKVPVSSELTHSCIGVSLFSEKKICGCRGK